MRRTWIVPARSRLVAVGVVLALLWLNIPESQVVSRTQRPQSDNFAVCYQIKTKARARYDYAVYLQSRAVRSRRDVVVWNSYRVEPFRLVWAGHDTLLVLVHNNQSYRWSVRANFILGLRVRTVWVAPGDSTTAKEPNP
jgi:hypothetical protein